MNGTTPNQHRTAGSRSGDPTTGALGRGRLTDEAYHYVRDGIMRGEFPTGSVLAEVEIARTLGSSRTPIRHALGLLLKKGLLEIGGDGS